MWPALFFLTNGFVQTGELADAGNKFFLANCKAAPASPSSEILTGYLGDIKDAKDKVVTAVVTQGMDVEEAMQTLYVNVVGSMVEESLADLNK